MDSRVTFHANSVVQVKLHLPLTYVALIRSSLFLACIYTTCHGQDIPVIDI